MRPLLITLALAFTAACAAAAAPGPELVGAGTPDEARACAQRGGEMRPVCMMGTIQCVVRYADAGQPCRDGDDCEGDCRAETMGPHGQAATGQCQATSDPCGCFANIEDGRITAALCRD